MMHHRLSMIQQSPLYLSIQSRTPINDNDASETDRFILLPLVFPLVRLYLSVLGAVFTKAVLTDYSLLMNSAAV